MLIAAGYTTALPTGPDVVTPIAPEIRAVWAELASTATREATVDVEGDDRVAALAPGGSVHKMLVHVLDNAAKYGADGAPARASVDEVDGRVHIVVVSPGPDPTDVPML